MLKVRADAYAMERRVNEEPRETIRKAGTQGKVREWPPAADRLELSNRLIDTVYAVGARFKWIISVIEPSHEEPAVRFRAQPPDPASGEQLPGHWIEVDIDFRHPPEEVRCNVVVHLLPGALDDDQWQEIEIFQEALRDEMSTTAEDWAKKFNLRLDPERSFPALYYVSSPRLGRPRQREPEERRKPIEGGRPRNADDDWAYEQVHVQKRPADEVYHEWLKLIGKRSEALANPQDSFKKAIRSRRRSKNK